MAKVMLIMDMPSCCLACPCSKFNSNLKNHWECEATGMELSNIDLDIERPILCPLREVPQKKEDNLSIHIPYNEGYLKGWNDCVDETLGEKR